MNVSQRPGNAMTSQWTSFLPWRRPARADGASIFSIFPSPFDPRPALARADASPRSSRHREAALGPDAMAAPPALSLGRGLSLCFREGRWVRVRGGGGGVGWEKESEKEKKRRIQRLKEENRLLKLEVAILLDIMTEMKIQDFDDDDEEEEEEEVEEEEEEELVVVSTRRGDLPHPGGEGGDLVSGPVRRTPPPGTERLK
ncbi:Protein chibby 1 [Merluccius polli]|uniref:Protein chibby 1 n=1 Tax=Merluccius polli TaxID=89951 RepID=A0AA47P9Q1_MERPO|nr:Protein chibby 1 [Merluccius polli]